MLEVIIKFFMIGLLIFGAIMTILSVGKPRQPVTGGLAAVTVIVNSLFVAFILIWWD